MIRSKASVGVGSPQADGIAWRRITATHWSQADLQVTATETVSERIDSETPNKIIIIIINGRYRLQLTSAIVYIKRGNLHQAGKCTAFFSMIVAMAANIRRQIDSITCLFPFLL